MALSRQMWEIKMICLDFAHNLPAQFRGGKYSFMGLAKFLSHLTGLVVSVFSSYVVMFCKPMVLNYQVVFFFV